MATDAYGYDSNFRQRRSSRRDQYDRSRRSSFEHLLRPHYADTQPALQVRNGRLSRSRPPPNITVYSADHDYVQRTDSPALQRGQDWQADIGQLVLESDSDSSSSSGDDHRYAFVRRRHDNHDRLRGRMLNEDTIRQSRRVRSLSLPGRQRARFSPDVQVPLSEYATLEVDPPRMPPRRPPAMPPLDTPPSSPSASSATSFDDFPPVALGAPAGPIPPRSGRPKANQNANFRLIDLMPGDPHDPIYARLYRFDSFETAPPYEALSYVWGNTQLPPVYIELTGCSFPVTQNLCSALRSLRYTTQSRLLWIDAICINQWDNVEKSHQVRIMGHIYANARRVLGYTGETDDQAEAIMTACRDHQIFPQTRRDLAAFMERPWFHRTWVIQEALLAQELALHCGTSRANFKDFIQLYERVRGILQLRTRPENLMELKAWYDSKRPLARRSSARIFGPRPGIKNGGNAGEASIGCLPFEDIVEMLLATTNFDCRNKRDKLYALLSLFEGRIPARLKPNYDKSVNKVFEGVVNFLSEREVLYEWFADAPCRFDHGVQHWDEHGGCVECYGLELQDMIRLT